MLAVLSTGDQNNDIFWEISRRPQGIAVRNASRTQSLDFAAAKEYIAGGVFTLKADAANNVFVHAETQTIDMKAQRKMQVNDEIVITHLGQDADYQLVGNASLWFKE